MTACNTDLPVRVNGSDTMHELETAKKDGLACHECATEGLEADRIEIYANHGEREPEAECVFCHAQPETAPGVYSVARNGEWLVVIDSVFGGLIVHATTDKNVHDHKHKELLNRYGWTTPLNSDVDINEENNQ